MPGMWIEVPDGFHVTAPGLREELKARLAAQLPPGQCGKGQINVPTTSYPARPGFLKYRVGYETEPCEMPPGN
jgi:hypothetical protein